ncbi:MAG: hypothetical protein ACI97A_001421 [Planctomycetota bacterium]|jgi:hypothetical protein
MALLKFLMPPPGRTLIIVVADNLLPVGNPQPIMGIGDVNGVLLKLRATKKMNGRVVDKLGQPVSNCQISTNAYYGFGMTSPDGFTWNPLFRNSKSLLTDAKGRFEGLVIPSSGEFGIEVSHPDMDGLVLVDMKGHEDKEIEIVMPVTTRIEGVLVDEQGSAVAFEEVAVFYPDSDAKVEWIISDDYLLDGPIELTNENGEFSIVGLTSARVTFEVLGDRLGELKLKPGTTNQLRLVKKAD